VIGLKRLDLAFADDAFAPAGESVDRTAATKTKAKARMETGKRYRKKGGKR
jgi:hypothetical protein